MRAARRAGTYAASSVTATSTGTTIAYVIVWSPVGGVEGAEWLLVALGLFADIATYSARAARGKTSYY